MLTRLGPARAGRTLFILLLLEALCFGPYLFSTGFYLDDYVFLHYVIRDVGPNGAPDLWAGIRSFAQGGFWNRPAEILHYPLLICLGGMKPWVYRFVGLGMEALLGVFMFLVFRRLSGDEYLGLLASVFALVFPNHTATHLWMTTSAPVAAVVFVFASLALHARGRRWAAQALYLAAMLEYEAVAFFPALFVAGRLARGGGLRAALRESWPYAASLAVVVLYQRGFSSLFLEEATRPVRLSLGHFFLVYREGLACTLTRLPGLLAEALFGGASTFGVAAWTALVPLVLLVTGALSREAAGSPRQRGGAPALAAAAAVLFVVSYVPYALTGTYVPTLTGMMSRVNFGAGIAAGMALAAFCGVLPARRRGIPVRAAVVALLLAAIVVMQWDAGAKWSRAWRVQQQTVADIRAALPPGPATVVLTRMPSNYHGGMIFRTTYDITRALWFALGRKDVRGDWYLGGRFEADGVAVVNGQGAVHRYPYRNLYFYDGGKRRLVAVSGPGAFTPL